MPSLPVPDPIRDVWGADLNEWLLVEHNGDGTQKTLTLAKGGTGATTAAAARAALGAVSQADLDAKTFASLFDVPGGNGVWAREAGALVWRAESDLAGGLNARLYANPADADSLANLHTARDQADSLGLPLLINDVYTISDRLILDKPNLKVVFGPKGKIVKKTTFGATNPGIYVSGAGTEIWNLTLDGNRAGGALGNGVEIRAAGCKLHGSYDVSHNKGSGLYVTTGGELDVFGSGVCSDNQSGTPGLSTGSVGIKAANGGVIRMHVQGRTSSNDGASVFLFGGAQAAGEGCTVKVWSTGGDYYGGVINSPRAEAWLRIDYPIFGGLSMFGVSDCNVFAATNYVGMSGPGASGYLNDRPGCELYGVTHSNVAVFNRGNSGYGMSCSWYALPVPYTGCTDNVLTIVSDGSESLAGGFGSDPCLTLAGGAQRNTCHVEAHGHNAAVHIGEGIYPFTNNWNTITVEADACRFGGLVIDAGNYNTVKVVSVDSHQHVQSTNPWNGLVAFKQDPYDYASAHSAGNMTSGSAALVITAPVGGADAVGTTVSKGAGVKVAGAGPAAADLITVVTAVTDFTHVTLRDAASTTVTGAVITLIPRQTTATVGAGSAAATLADATGWEVGEGILLVGAGANGGDHVSTIEAIAGAVVTLKHPAVTAVAGAVAKYACAVGNVVEIIHSSSPTAAEKPKYIVEADTNTGRNVVTGRSNGDYVTSTLSDLGPALGSGSENTFRIDKGAPRIEREMERMGILAGHRMPTAIAILGASAWNGILLPVEAGVTYTSVVFFLGTVGAGVTLFKVGIWDANGTLIVGSADLSTLVTTAGNANKWQKGDLTAPWTPIVGQVVYVGAVEAGGTPPNLGRILSLTGIGTAMLAGKPRPFATAAGVSTLVSVTPADSNSEFAFFLA